MERVGVVGVGVEGHEFAGAGGADHEGAGAGAVGLEPGVAEVAGLLVAHDGRLVDDAADGGAEAVEQEGGRLGVGDVELERVGAGGADAVGDVVFVEAELGDDEAGGLVEDDGALQAEGDVCGGDGSPEENFRSVRRWNVQRLPSGWWSSFRRGWGRCRWGSVVGGDELL